jgi:hypothetical protein
MKLSSKNYSLFFIINLEKIVERQTALNYGLAISELSNRSNNNNSDDSIDSIDSDNDDYDDTTTNNNNSSSSSNEFIGSPTSTLPSSTTINHLTAAIRKFHERKQLTPGACGSVKYFGRMKRGKHIYYSDLHLSKAAGRYSRSVSLCLVRIGDK